MQQKDLQMFILENRDVIDAYIESSIKRIIHINDSMRCTWIHNNEWLKCMAEKHGVTFEGEQII